MNRHVQYIITAKDGAYPLYNEHKQVQEERRAESGMFIFGIYDLYMIFGLVALFPSHLVDLASWCMCHTRCFG